MSDPATILIIDDEPNLCRTLALILRKSGYAVTTTASVREANRHLQTTAYNLIFLDLQMPDGNGMDFLPGIRQMHPETSVFILTASAPSTGPSCWRRATATCRCWRPIWTRTTCWPGRRR